MSALKTYMLLLFGITAMLYLFGYSSPFLKLLANVGVSETGVSGNPINGLLDSMLNIFLDPAFLGLVGVSTVIAWLGGGGTMSFGIYYLVPIYILISLMNYFILPTDIMNTMYMNPIVGLFAIGFLDLLLALSVIEFVRGG